MDDSERKHTTEGPRRQAEGRTPTMPPRAQARRIYRPQTRGECALLYYDLFGWTVVPAAGKRPRMRWSVEVIPTRPDRKTLLAWWEEYPHANLALLTGARSGVVAGDVDPRHGGDAETLVAAGFSRETLAGLSGGGGEHFYYAYPDDGLPLPSLPTFAPGIEIKADGAIIILPPSAHPVTGQPYRWLAGHGPGEAPLARLSDALVADLRAHPGADGTRAVSRVYDVRDHSHLVYSWEQTVALTTTLVNAAIKRTQDAHRNDIAYWLGRQLGTLGLTTDELIAVMTLYQRAVRGADGALEEDEGSDDDDE